MNSNETPIEPELRLYLDQLTAIEQDAGRLIDGLTDAQLAWRETLNTWSVADCLNHLLVTGGHSLKSIRRALVDAHARGSLRRGPFRHGVRQTG